MKVPLYREIQQDINRWLVSDPAHPERIAEQALREQRLIAPSVEADAGKMFTSADFAGSLTTDIPPRPGPPGGPGGGGGGGILPGGPGGPGGGAPSPRCAGQPPIGPDGGILPGGPTGFAIPGLLRFYEDRSRGVRRALGLE
jgi:hypothetical protein